MNNWLFKTNPFATVEDRLFIVLLSLLCLGHVKSFTYNSHQPAGLVEGSVALRGVSPVLRALPPPRDSSCLDIQGPRGPRRKNKGFRRSKFPGKGLGVGPGRPGQAGSKRMKTALREKKETQILLAEPVLRSPLDWDHGTLSTKQF